MEDTNLVNETITLTEEELTTLNQIRQVDSNLTTEFGLIERALQELAKRSERTKVALSKYEEDRAQFFKSLNEKYGDGNIDLNTGNFTPNN